MELDLDRRRGSRICKGRQVTKRKRRAAKNPILDSWMYEVEYEDGHKLSMAAYAIVSNLFEKVDQDG